MELTAEIYILGLIISAVSIFLLTPLIFRRTIKTQFAGFEQLSQMVTKFSDKEGSQEQIADAVDGISSLGTLASNANEILNDEVVFDALLTTIAQRAFKVAKMSMMGVASGDVKKKAYAERRVNEAIIDGMQEISPMLGLFLKVTGLGEELREDPELFGYIMQIVSEKGLLNMFDPSMLALPTGEQEQVIKSAIQGIDF